MKKMGVILGSLAAFTFAGCSMDSVDEAVVEFEQIGNAFAGAAPSLLGGGGYSTGGVPGNYPPNEEPIFKIDSARQVKNDEYIIWTSFIYTPQSSPTIGEMQIQYSWENEAAISTIEYLPDTVGKYLVFPVEISGLQAQKNYSICLLLKLIAGDYEEQHIGPCMGISTF